MVRLTRRSFVRAAATASVVPLLSWFENQALAGPPLMRYDAASAQGQAMLKLYATGVKNMMAAAERDPKGWVFQWYTHFVKGSTDKPAEISRIFGTSPSPQQALAQAIWDTCQAHSGQPEDYFLPWHRMFVLFFESIVRSFSDPSFTLPYWDYSVAGAAHGIVPTEFRQPNDPTFAPLYQKKRNSGANAGQPIGQGQFGSPVSGDPLNLLALAECTYSPDGAKQGFCLALDSHLHGNVHGLVGNTENMGAIEWAAEDPIFWMHHCNIDRLWASWNLGGRKNNAATPGFLSKQFTFANSDGSQVVAAVKNFLDIGPLGYTYDRFEPLPPCRAVPRRFPIKVETYYINPGDPVELGSRAVTVTLRAPTKAAIAVSFADRLRALGSTRRLYLVIRDLHAHAQPGVLYHLFLDLPSDVPPERGNAHHVGIINFFDAVAHGNHTTKEPTHPQDKFFSFDVTDVAKELQTRGLSSETPTLTIAPVGEPAEAAKPVVGRILLVAQ